MHGRVLHEAGAADQLLRRRGGHGVADEVQAAQRAPRRRLIRGQVQAAAMRREAGAFDARHGFDDGGGAAGLGLGLGGREGGASCSNRS